MNSDHGIMPNHESVHSLSSTPSRIGFGRPDEWVNGHHHHHHHGHGHGLESPKKMKKAIRPSSLSRVGCGRPDEWVGDHHRSSRKNAAVRSWRVKSSSTTRKENDNDDSINDTICQNSICSAPTVMFRHQDDIHQQLGKKKNNYHKFNSKKIDDEENEDDADDADYDKEEDTIDLNGSIGDFVISTTKNKKYGGGIDSSVHSLLTEHSVSSTSSSRVGFCRPEEWVGSHHRSSTRKNGAVRSWRVKASTTRNDNDEIADDTICPNSFRSAPTVMVRRPDNDRLHHQHQGKEKKNCNTLQSKTIDNEVDDDDEEEEEEEYLIDLDGSIGDFVISTTKNNKKYGGAGGIDASMHSLLTEASSLSSSLTTSSTHLSTAAAHHSYSTREYTPYESNESFVTAIKEKIYANTKTMLSPHPYLHPITNDTNELQGKIKRSDTTLTSNGKNNHRPTAMLPLQPPETSRRHSSYTTSTIGSSSSNHKCNIRAYNRPDAWIGGGGKSSYNHKPTKRSWKVKKIVDVTKNNSSMPDLMSESLCSRNDASTLSSSSSIL